MYADVELNIWNVVCVHGIVLALRLVQNRVGLGMG